MQRDLPVRDPELVNLTTQSIATATGVLVAITDAHALSDTQRKRLESAYGAIGSHMAEHDQFSPVTNEVHAQGSMLIGTTVRPEGRAEIDVDLVLSLVAGLHQRIDCKPLLDETEKALREHAERQGLKIKRKRRCVQLQYQGDMHADITPVVHHPRSDVLHGNTFGLVPDRDLSRYLGTNPKGYGGWFTDSAKMMPVFIARRDLEIAAKADVVPLPSVAIFDRLLARIVQFFKIHRNVFFIDDLDNCTPSAVITTIVVRAYRDLANLVFISPLDLLMTIWRNLPHYIDRQLCPDGTEVWYVENPAAPGDNLADRMNSTPERQYAFARWYARFHDDLLALVAHTKSAGGVDVLAKRVTKSYGSIAANGITKSVLAATQTQRAAGRVVVPTRSTAAVIASASSVAMASQPHRFFGSNG